MKEYYVYILASKSKTLYIGVTNDLPRRLFEHNTKLYPEAFTSRYNVRHLVYFEQTETRMVAVQREKQLKKYKRQWKIELIEKQNPRWKDLSEDWKSI